MPLRLNDVVSLCLGLVLAASAFVASASAQTVWSGLTYSFSRPDGVDGTLPENQDEITPNVVFARKTTEGLYNAASEPGWNLDRVTSPEFTRWATTLVEGNEGLEEVDIAASNYANLQFTNWLAAYGGGVALDEQIQGRRAVVHLVNDDIYLDIQFSYWAVFRAGGTGGFAYLRAEPPAPPVTNGDYNGNLVVDAADYTVWRDTFGQQVEPGTGADGTGAGGVPDGVIDELDYDFWKERFGNVIVMGGGSLAAVPEPATCLLLVSGWLIMAVTRKRSPRGPGQSF